jgi:hypothetical protein
MIPNILHTAFFGDWAPRRLNLRCEQSWGRVLPGWRRMHWTRANLPEALQADPWFEAASRDVRAGLKLTGAQLNFGAYLRHWILYTHGGVIVDNDLELLQVPPLEDGCFVGWQSADPKYVSVNCAIMGSEPGHEFHAGTVARIAGLPVNTNPTHTGPYLLTNLLAEQGLRRDGTEQTVAGVHVYPPEVFYPWAWYEKPDRGRVTARTVSLHWWEGTGAPPGTRHPNSADDFAL